MSRRHQSRNGTNKNLEMNKPKADVSDLWIQHQRRNTKTTKSWSCIYCPERKICLSETDLWNHAEKEHQDKIPSDQDELDRFRKSYESNSALKRLVDPLIIISVFLWGAKSCKAVCCQPKDKVRLT